jgi:hypothetical protein
VTDTLEVFPYPEETEDGEYEVHFLAHGLRHMPDSSADRALALKRGEQLLAMRDIQNPQDRDAIALRTAETFERDMYLIGYCPRYLRAALIRLLDSGCAPTITVERVNYPPAPLQLRVLCKAVMTWSEGFKPFCTPEYELIVSPNGSAPTLSLPPASSPRNRPSDVLHAAFTLYKTPSRVYCREMVFGVDRLTLWRLWGVIR